MTACGFVMCAVTADMKPTTALFGTAAAKWLIATFIVGLSTNFFALGAISWKFWVNSSEKRKAANVKAAGTISLRTVLVILVESTAIYSGTKFINLMLLVAGTNVAYVFFCLVSFSPCVALHRPMFAIGHTGHWYCIPSLDYPCGIRKVLQTLFVGRLSHWFKLAQHTNEYDANANTHSQPARIA